MYVSQAGILKSINKGKLFRAIFYDENEEGIRVIYTSNQTSGSFVGIFREVVSLVTQILQQLFLLPLSNLFQRLLLEVIPAP